jgi:hypothetical protein
MLINCSNRVIFLNELFSFVVPDSFINDFIIKGYVYKFINGDTIFTVNGKFRHGKFRH